MLTSSPLSELDWLPACELIPGGLVTASVTTTVLLHRDRSRVAVLRGFLPFVEIRSDDEVASLPFGHGSPRADLSLASSRAAER
jgi:hypothetical protein